ncbi:methyltransferase family protein [Halopiger goleimassiliensis]|uniref:methyltransferase family protein n=1 Tax=Halopiger goleimassiliensis TaxID=1293048 RepID=UPI00067799F8|nr:isoprenylcysteine carboxylmethyltransferase family protein [Halopiger goleimassiliensis]
MLSDIGSADAATAAFVLVVGVWVLSDWSIAYRRGRPSGAASDRGSRHAVGAGMIGGVLGAVAASVFVPSLALPTSRLLFWCGLAVILAGVAVRQYAVWTLGAAFSLEVTVDANDEVIESGPYGWVRHPSYTGGLLSLVGIGITTGNALSVLVALAAGLAGYGYRIRVEERALREALEEYDAYAARTPYRLVPFVW